MEQYTKHLSAELSPTEVVPRAHVGLDLHKDTVVVAIAYLGPRADPLAVEDRGTIPKMPGERVKTDRRDARELARLSALGYLTSVWLPDSTQEAMRNLVRLRTEMKSSIQKTIPPTFG